MNNTAAAVLRHEELKKFLDSKTKNNIVNSTMYTGRDLILGAVAGSVAGALIGRPAFYIGLGAMALGYYKAVPWLPCLGLGMSSFAFGTAFKNATGLRTARHANEPFSFSGAWEKAKERLSELKGNVLTATYLDKVFTKKEETTTEGEVSGLGNADMSALDKYEQQVIASAMEYQNNSPSMSGAAIRSLSEADIDMI